MNKRYLIIGGMIGIFFIICSFFCCFGFILGDEDSTVELTKEPTVAKTTTVKPTATKKEEIKKVDVDTLIKDYEDNEIAADKIYKNKRYEITGPVDNISEVLGSVSVTLSNDEFAITAVRLNLKDKDKDHIAKLKKGEEITIIGTIEGKGWDVDVKDVEFK